QAADAVAAHLGARAVGVAQLHAGAGPGVQGRRGADDAVGADAGVAVAQGPRHAIVERVGAVRIEQDEEVVAEAVVLGQAHVSIPSARPGPGTGAITRPAVPAPRAGPGTPAGR